MINDNISCRSVISVYDRFVGQKTLIIVALDAVTTTTLNTYNTCWR